LTLKATNPSVLRDPGGPDRYGSGENAVINH
jgi:hypothetical protein